MHEHEVPTHVQAEDRVLLWFTFPQIVALTAVAALSYGAYSLAPFGPSGVRMALAILLGLAGVAAVAGKIGGRKLPLVAADLLRFWLGPRRYAGAPAELARSEPPPPPPPTPNPLQLMVKRTRQGLRKLRKNRTRRTGRRPFRAHCLFGKRRKRKNTGQGNGHRVDIQSIGVRGGFLLLAAAIAVVTVATVTVVAPKPALADGHDQWFGEEFSIPEPVPGRRLFVEGLSVTGNVATVTLRAATVLDIQVRAYGGAEGETLAFQRSASLAAGQRVSYDLPLGGDAPSVTVSWQDELGEAGALGLEGEELPWPLPSVEGEICDLSVTTLAWAPGSITGTVASTCATSVEERLELAIASGHHEQSVTALIEASVSDLSGVLTIASGSRSTTVALVPDGSTAFTLTIGSGEAVHTVVIDVVLEANTMAPLPALVELTHHPERTEDLTETAVVTIPAFGDTVTETVSIPLEDGTSTEHTVSASCYVPQSTVRQDVVFTTVHPEHVRAAVTPRAPLVRARSESLALALSVASDDPYEALASPESEEEPPPSNQTAVTPEVLAWLLGVLNGQ